MENSKIKPIFVMYLRMTNSTNENDNAYYIDVRKYLEKKLEEEYNVIVIPTYEGNSNSQTFYPNEFKEEKIENFVEEMAKKTAFKNIRIKFDKE
jgi:hypothetical protein